MIAFAHTRAVTLFTQGLIPSVADPLERNEFQVTLAVVLCHQQAALQEIGENC